MAEVKGDLTIRDNLGVDENAKFQKGLDASYLEIIDQKISGEAGGTFNENVWKTRDLTTTIVNDFATSITLATLNGDGGQFVIPAGVYHIEAFVPAFNVDEHVGRLADVTDAAGEFGDTVVLGTSEFAADTAKCRDSDNEAMVVASSSQTRSQIEGRLTVGRSTTLEIQHRCTSSQALDGFGSDAGFYVTDNVYTVMKMWQVREGSS
jgi:hypothetical protein